jgi:hypothetical protein
VQVIHLLCPRERVFALAQEWEERFEDSVTYAVAASGLVNNQPVGFVVLTTVEHAFDEELLQEIESHPDVSGYSPFALPDDELFSAYGCELIPG